MDLISVLKNNFNIIDVFYSGLIISGGQPRKAGWSVEVFVPSNGHHCKLPDLPVRRDGHSMEERVVCGGFDYERSSDSDEYWAQIRSVSGPTSTSCLSLTDNGTWENTATLLELR